MPQPPIAGPPPDRRHDGCRRGRLADTTDRATAPARAPTTAKSGPGAPSLTALSRARPASASGRGPRATWRLGTAPA